jgi:hypothetical protein
MGSSFLHFMVRLGRSIAPTGNGRGTRMLKRNFANIITYIRIPITTAASESINSKIQRLKTCASGYRNEGRFATAILFYCGGLDLHPTHSNS